MDIFSEAKSVASKESFIRFLEALRMDYLNDPGSWENQTIDSFLWAVASWVKDYSGPDVDFEKPDWKTVAAMFYMGKMYE